MNTKAVSVLADSILYLLSLLRARSRKIDRYIDYFGERRAAGPPGRHDWVRSRVSPGRSASPAA
ncbi:MAG TPA: hypothetical protein VFR64_00140 [Methylomirabilota bacterium]|nr:hypothetical protein [Methylomirabilota bacterium]